LKSDKTLLKISYANISEIESKNSLVYKNPFMFM
jgi:hypothetical protein